MYGTSHKSQAEAEEESWKESKDLHEASQGDATLERLRRILKQEKLSPTLFELHEDPVRGRIVLTEE